MLQRSIAHSDQTFLLQFWAPIVEMRRKTGVEYKQLIIRQIKNKYNNQQKSKLTRHRNQRMTHLIQQNQYIPKLLKNKPLQNPYQSNATTVSGLSRIFLLNDRRKVTLTQSSQQQGEQQNHNHSHQLNRLPTFKPTQTISMSEVNEHLKNSRSTQIMNTNGSNDKEHQVKFKIQNEYSKSNKIDNEISARKSDINQQLYQNNKSNSPLNSQKAKAVGTPQFALVKNKGTPNQSKEQYNQQYTYTQNQTYSYYENPSNKLDQQVSKNQKKFHQQISEQSKLYKYGAVENNNNGINIQNRQSIAKQLQSSQSQSEDDELVAQEQNVAHLLSKAIQTHNKSKIISQNYRPSLQTASRVVGPQQSSKGSLIDKIKAQTFCQSRVLEEKQQNYKNKNIKIAESHIINFQQKLNQYDNKNEVKVPSNATNTARRRTKIFQDFSKRQKRSITPCTQQKYPLTPKKLMENQTNPNFNNTQFFNQTSRYIEEVQRKIQINSYNKNYSKDSHRNQYNYRRDQQNASRLNTPPANSYAVCPHTQCILKSLQIIDKLTNRYENVEQSNSQVRISRKLNKAQQKQNENAKILKQIQSQAMEVSMEMDKFIAEITLQSLLQEDTSRKIKQIKIQVERLHAKIKQSSQEQFIMKRKQYRLQESYIRALSVVDYRWELCVQLQKMSKVLHYMQVVQERYKIWKFRLNSLSQRIKDIMKVDRPSQQRKLADMSQHIRELEESIFYGLEVTQLGIVEAYNSFVEKEMKELRQGLECIKNDILSR